jgi:hypothetical protein
VKQFVKHFYLALFVTSLSMLPGCAKVGDPLPPLVGIPEKAQGLDAHQTGYTVVLEWTNPRAHADGSPMSDLAVVHVFRNGAALRPVPANGPGKRQSLTIPMNDALGVDQTFFVVTETTKGRSSEPSGTFTIKPLDVPGPVGSTPEAIVDQRRIVLTWAPPAEKRELTNGYRVRRTDGGVDTVVKGEKFEDSAYVKDQTYTYTITPVRLNAQSIPVPGPSEVSKTVKAVDTKAPAKPITATVVMMDAGALINWTANAEEDLAKYRVWSGPNREGVTVLKDDLPKTQLQFLDEKFRQGTIYAVTAVDDSGNESEKSFPEIVP